VSINGEVLMGKRRKTVVKTLSSAASFTMSLQHLDCIRECMFTIDKNAHPDGGIAYDHDDVTVLSVDRGSPAFLAGVLPGRAKIL
jgi:hypothetical protein